MKLTRLLLPALTLSLLSSCASVSVKDERRAAKQPVQKPVRIYVADFRTDTGVFKAAGDDGKDLEAFKKKTANMLANYLVPSLEAHVAPAQRTSDPGAVPKGAWLVTGDFVRVNTGSRILRSGIGLGAGGTKMETRVKVYDPASGKEPFLTFETTGGSNAMPGMIASTSPVGAAISIASQAMLGVTNDCARTSRMITGALNEYAVDRQWLPKEKRYSAKKLGQYQLVHEQYSR